MKHRWPKWICVVLVVAWFVAAMLLGSSLWLVQGMSIAWRAGLLFLIYGIVTVAIVRSFLLARRSTRKATEYKRKINLGVFGASVYLVVGWACFRQELPAMWEAGLFFSCFALFATALAIELVRARLTYRGWKLSNPVFGDYASLAFFSLLGTFLVAGDAPPDWCIILLMATMGVFAALAFVLNLACARQWDKERARQRDKAKRTTQHLQSGE